MGKNKKSKDKKGKDKGPQVSSSSAAGRPVSKSRVTLEDVLAVGGPKGKKGKTHKDDVVETYSSSGSTSSSSDMPPESEWDEQALLLKKRIENGEFDHLLAAGTSNAGDDDDDDESSIEEVDLGDVDEEDTENHQDESEEEEEQQDDSEGSDEESEEVAEKAGEKDEGEDDADSSEEDDNLVSKEVVDGGEGVESPDEESHDGDDNEDEEDDDDRATLLSKKNHITSKALHIVTESLQARKRELPWAETFDVVSSVPLPFDRKPSIDGEAMVSIHDDLKREVAFYDVALAAVAQAREECSAAKIPFSRPDDFFAEMVKTDDHMAKVKDRLIFETKKMDAVSQRKSNKEHKLRAKESQANKAAEKAKRKREHFASLDDWASSAAAQRGRRALDDDEDEDRLRSFSQGRGGSGGASGTNKKRLIADKKFGFGGKKGRFKQNDRKTLNDTSSFNPRGGSFSGGMKKVSAHKAGGKGKGKSKSSSNKRPGKRARDAKRSQR